MFRVRWLGRVSYREAWALQRAIAKGTADDYLLLMEHPHVLTLGVRARIDHILEDVEALGAEVVKSDRGGDVTYHGPGQLVGYPIVNVPMAQGSIPGHVHAIEQVIIDALADLGLPGTGRLDGYPGVWTDCSALVPRKICAVGVRVSRGRSLHGFALNVDTDLSWFSRIVPCGLVGRPVTSIAREGVTVTMEEVVDAVAERAALQWAPDRNVERQEVAWRPGRNDSAGARDVQPRGSTNPAPVSAPIPASVSAPVASSLAMAAPVKIGIGERKPPWLRVPARMGHDYMHLRQMMRALNLVTVCEEAGCPNIYECWADGTATFMINGEDCTRACGFCLVRTQRPGPLDEDEPARVAEAVERLELEHAVVTAVARDDLYDGGASAFAATIKAIRHRRPGVTIEVLIPDCKGRMDALSVIFGARPDVVNHNLETVARLQKQVRPSAGYARSLAVLARARFAGLVTKSGMMLGLGESEDEVIGAMSDLRAAGVQILTLGQYIRPSAAHLPVRRWWTPDEFANLAELGASMGFAHVEASPLTRSSYHAKGAASAARARQASNVTWAGSPSGVGAPSTGTVTAPPVAADGIG